MTKRKLMALLMTLVMVVSLFTACGSKEEAPADAPAEEEEAEAPAEEPASDKKPVLGFLPSAMTSNFFIYTSEGAKAVAEANGYELMIQSPPSEDDYAAAVSIMEDMITQGVAARNLLLRQSRKLTQRASR